MQFFSYASPRISLFFQELTAVNRFKAIKSTNFTILRLKLLLLRDLRPISLMIFSVLLSLWTSAQLPVSTKPASNFRQKSYRIAGDSLQIDTISVISKTFMVDSIDPGDYRLDFVNAILYWNRKPVSDSVTIRYRVFPYKLNPVTQRMRYDSIMNNMSITPYEFNNDLSESQRGMFNFGNIKAEGSFGRQIAFGNSQDAVFNSIFNLQLNGMLGDSIELQAAITDNNIPVQPDGTTQQLNEFDQVFLQFKKRNWQLNLGDIDIRQTDSYFLKFYKRLQGISFQTTNRISKNVTSGTLASGSIAKGKFTRNIIQALEGNQGPYRLSGANNEFFFIVLANTERVFIDGELNTAEISFTPRRMITKDSRIQVEFEYADRNFLNANLYLKQEFEFNQKLKLKVGFFNNSDAKNSSINQVLDNNQKLFLANVVGDSIQKAFYPSAALDTFAAGKILYQKIYYTSGTGIDSFYKYSTDPDSAKYNVSFTEVGQGNGNYVTEFNGANGKVYRFIMPVGTLKHGNYEAAILLITPKKQQVFNLVLDYAINKNTILKTEVATSIYDVNSFSKIGNGDDQGWAAKFLLTNNKTLHSKSNLRLNTMLDYEYVQDKFKPLERLRTVEFSRDWGLPLILLPATENIIRAGAELKNDKNNFLNYRFMNYNRSDNYNGFQNGLSYVINRNGWQINNDFTLTNFSAATTKGYFFRPIIDVSKQFKQLHNWRAGFKYSLERNASRNKSTDTLTADARSMLNPMSEERTGTEYHFLPALINTGRSREKNSAVATGVTI